MHTDPLGDSTSSQILHRYHNCAGANWYQLQVIHIDTQAEHTQLPLKGTKTLPFPTCTMHTPRGGVLRVQGGLESLPWLEYQGWPGAYP